MTDWGLLAYAMITVSTVVFIYVKTLREVSKND